MSPELETALEAAAAAAGISRAYYKGNFTVTTKADRTPVTQADVECEQVIREIILGRFPGHGFYGEETGKTRSEGRDLWLVDPIDGTRAYISGLPVWGTLIAVDDGQRGRIGLIDQPYIGERFIGVIGDRAGWPGVDGAGMSPVR